MTKTQWLNKCYDDWEKAWEMHKAAETRAAKLEAALLDLKKTATQKVHTWVCVRVDRALTATAEADSLINESRRHSGSHEENK